MTSITVVFVEFSTSNLGKFYFAGSDLQSVLDDTKNGTEFGGTKFTSYRLVTEAEAKECLYFASGVESIKAVRCKSYFLGLIR